MVSLLFCQGNNAMNKCSREKVCQDNLSLRFHISHSPIIANHYKRFIIYYKIIRIIISYSNISKDNVANTRPVILFVYNMYLTFHILVTS